VSAAGESGVELMAEWNIYGGLRSQWDCLLENLGQWQGSFTSFSPQGELLEDTPTVVSLQGLNENKTIRQIVRRYLPLTHPTREVEPQELVLEYSSLNRSILFFNNGAFSQGSMQFAPFSEFAAEFCLLESDRRLRLIQMYNRNSQLEKITLIREKLRAENDSPNAPVVSEHPHLTVDDLLGEWQGQAVTIYPDLRSPDIYPTKLQLDLNNTGRLVQQLSFGDRSITSSARIDGKCLYFDQGSQPVQVLLLPDGASCNCPLQINNGQAFILEVGWLHAPHQRQRMIRRYDAKGGWVSLTLVTESKVACERVSR
jgi:Domain of unknown function (DUF3598)